MELSFHAGIIEHLKIPGQAIIDAIRSGTDELKFVSLGMSRDSYTDYLGKTLDFAAVIGIIAGIIHARKTCLPSHGS